MNRPSVWSANGLIGSLWFVPIAIVVSLADGPTCGLHADPSRLRHGHNYL
jgi:hypothetical protein